MCQTILLDPHKHVYYYYYYYVVLFLFLLLSLLLSSIFNHCCHWFVTINQPSSNQSILVSILAISWSWSIDAYADYFCDFTSKCPPPAAHSSAVDPCASVCVNGLHPPLTSACTCFNNASITKAELSDIINKKRKQMETKQNNIKQNETKWNKMKQNETKPSKMKRPFASTDRTPYAPVLAPVSITIQ
jgi:hypothetical protein